MKHVPATLSVITIISIGAAFLASPPAGSTTDTASARAGASAPARAVPPSPVVVATTPSPPASPATPSSVAAPTSGYPVEVVRSLAVPSPVATTDTTKTTKTTSAPAPAPAPAAADDHTAYINAMYLAVVPARQRAAMAGRYVVGYNLPALSCGTGCTGMFGTEARSSFNATFFAQSKAYQRNTIAHEAAHAYGFLMFGDYATPSWAAAGGWQADFHAADRSFAGKYDAEAWASCVAWQESGFNNLVNQITQVCTPQAAALAMAQIS